MGAARGDPSADDRADAEHNLENMAYAALVMSTIPSGTIRSIDSTAARKSAGVLTVISHVNAPKLNSNVQQGNLAEPKLIPFADNTIHYVGQRIAVVVDIVDRDAMCRTPGHNGGRPCGR